MRTNTARKGLLAAACTLPLALAVACNGATDDGVTENGVTENGVGQELEDTWDEGQQEVEGWFATGGDTTCSDFIEQDEADQYETVAQYLEEQAQENGHEGQAPLDQEGQEGQDAQQQPTFDADDPEVQEATIRILEACEDPAQADTPISEADPGSM